MTQIYLPFPEMINLATLPSLPLSRRSCLPEEPGVYFVVQQTRIRYIGQTQSLKTRWAQHHRLEQYLKEDDMVIAWLPLSKTLTRSAIERACINYFTPLDNGKRLPRQAMALPPRHYDSRYNTTVNKKETVYIKTENRLTFEKLNTLGKRLRLCRHAHGLRAMALASMVDITPNYLSLVEHDRKVPGLAMLQKLATALQVTSSQLLGETPLF